jgi:hypothetical protein
MMISSLAFALAAAIWLRLPETLHKRDLRA